MTNSFRFFIVGISIMIFIAAILLLIKSIEGLGLDIRSHVESSISNPFVGLFIGLIATAILQSSSTTTTILVAAVAAGSLPLNYAIPAVLGANVGTTLTSSLVAMSYITKAIEFKRAVIAGTMHDFFNICSVILLLPLELNFQVLTKASKYLTTFVGPSNRENASISRNFPPLFDWIDTWIIEKLGAIASLLLAVILLLICLNVISRLLHKVLVGSAKKSFETTVFSSSKRAFGWGLLVTSASQSSTLTSCLIVPLVATGKVKLQRAFEFILGANLGTTVTALLTATLQSEVAMNLAIVHFLFNTIGVVLFLSVPLLKNLPIKIASSLSTLTLRKRPIGLLYILATFFIIPFVLIYLTS
ncbi:MAG: Na/Pi symporter [Bacteroidota bacterium]